MRSIRTAAGAIPFPTSAEARSHTRTDADRELVADRVETQFVGSAVQVADQLERLRDATEADELIITTITHDHRDRVRSYQPLAEEWADKRRWEVMPATSSLASQVVAGGLAVRDARTRGPHSTGARGRAQRTERRWSDSPLAAFPPDR